MEYNWEEFKPGPVEQSGTRLHVTINRHGNLFLNRHAIEALGDPESVLLLYDRRRSVIGVRRAPASSENAFRLKPKERNRSSGRILYIANFCRHHAIQPDETMRFPAAEVNKDGVLILDLNEVRPAAK